MIIRAGILTDLPAITELINHYIENTHITFDVQPYVPAQREKWFHEHNDGRRYRMLVAEEPGTGILGYAATGAFRNKGAYDTTVEISVACRPAATSKGVGGALYTELFKLIEGEDIHSVVAGIAQPNPASVRLHERFGFKKVGTFTEVGRKFGKFWDVMWMEKRMG
ncbi:MAG TPA: GNAT family N-acetyltransferase [Terriglobales bacterium]